MADATLNSKKKKKFDSNATSLKESDEHGSRYMILSQEEEDDLVKDNNKKSKESFEEEEEEEYEYEYGLPIFANRYLAVASNHQHVELKRRRILEKEMNAAIQRKQDKRKDITFTLYIKRFLECPKLPWCEEWRTCSPNDTYILKTKKFLIETRSSLRLKQVGSHELQVAASLSNKTPPALLESIVRAARIFHLNREELYFVGERDYGPFSPVNELESLNSILMSLKCLISSGKSDGKEVLQLLEKEIRDMIISYVDDISVQYPDGDPENASMTPCMQSADARYLDKLLELGLAKPTDTKLRITNVSEGKGLVASEEIDIGDTVLEIPKSRIISEDVVLQSKMFKDLKDMERFNIDPEEKFLLWIMKEKNNLNSEFQYYFQNLPQFKTGLSFGDDALATLEGTGLEEKILLNKELLKSRHKILLPLIQKVNLPSSFGDFLWAWELLHSCGMHILFPDGKWKACLVPVAGFFNHSLCPHVLHCDLGTDTLKFVASRPCRKGQQCYMSYGKFSGSYLITFYGFLPKGHNYHDVLPLDYWLCDDRYYFDYVPGSEWNKPMIREIMSVKSPNFGLPQPLLKLLHRMYANTVPPETTVEQVIYETLYHRVDGRLDALDVYQELWKKERSKDLELSWDLQLALDYRESFIRILTTVRRSCLLALRPWKMDVFYFVLGAERYFEAMAEAETFFQKCSIG